MSALAVISDRSEPKFSRVRSTNLVISDVLRGVMLDRPETGSGMDEMNAVRSLQRPSDVIDIVFKGKHISFSYSGPPPDELPPKFLKSNEGYGYAIRDVLKEVEGVTHYLGIMGGLDASLAQMILLAHKSQLQVARIVDKDSGQIFYGMLKLGEYDELTPEQIRHRGIFPALVGASVCYPHKFPQTTISFGYMSDAVREIDVPGRYFVYLSNAFDIPVFRSEEGENWPGPMPKKGIGFYYGACEGTDEVLRSLSANLNVQEGSLVMFAQPNSFMSMILKKEEDTFVVFSFIGKDAELYTPMGRTGFNLDRRAQNDFLRSMIADDSFFREARK